MLGDAHDESPPRTLVVDASREYTVLGIMHREAVRLYYTMKCTSRLNECMMLPPSLTAGPSAVRQEVRASLGAEV